MRYLISAITLVALLAMPLALTVAATIQPPGPGMGAHQRGVVAVSYQQNATIAPTSASVALMGVIEPSIPINGSLTAAYQDGVLNAVGEFASDVPEYNSTVSGSLTLQVNGAFNYVASEGRAYSSEEFSVSLSFTSESGGNVTRVSANLTGTSEGERVLGNYSYTHTYFQGPVYIKRDAGATSFEVTFDLIGDVYSNTTTKDPAYAVSHLWGNLTIDFNTGNQFQDAMYAYMLAQAVTNLVGQLGLQNNVTVTVDNERGAVTISFDLYLGPGMMPKPMPGVPGVGLGRTMGMERMRMPVTLAGFTEDVNITYSLQLSVQVDAGEATCSLEVNVTGIPVDFFGVDSFRLEASLGYDEQADTTILQVKASVDGIDSPASAFYPLVMAARLGLMKFSDAKVVFIGRDGVAFRLDSSELTEVVITRENRTLINDLKLVYNGTVYGFGVGGELMVVGPEGGHVVIPALGNYTKITVENAFKATIKAGGGKVVALARNLQVEIYNPMGSFRVRFENIIFKGSLGITTLDQAQVSGMLPAEMRGSVIGPGMQVTGVLSGGGEVEIPLTKTPVNPALARILPDGTVEIISNVEVVNGVMKARVPGFSVLVPVDLSEAGQPPGETTTTNVTAETTAETTTTTETTTPTSTETETTMTATSPTQTETEARTAVTTTPATTTSTPTSPARTAETAETTTPTTSETATQATTEAVQEATTPTATTPATAGGIQASLLIAAIVVLALVAAAIMLFRR